MGKIFKNSLGTWFIIFMILQIILEIILSCRLINLNRHLDTLTLIVSLIIFNRSSHYFYLFNQINKLQNCFNNCMSFIWYLTQKIFEAQVKLFCVLIVTNCLMMRFQAKFYSLLFLLSLLLVLVNYHIHLFQLEYHNFKFPQGIWLFGHWTEISRTTKRSHLHWLFKSESQESQ